MMMSKHPNKIILLSWHIHHKSQNGVSTVVTFVHQYNFISYISLSLKEFHWITCTEQKIQPKLQIL